MSLTLTKRGRIWHYSGTVAGRRLRGTTGATEKEIAQRFAAEVEHRAWQRRFDGPGAGLTMAQTFTAYLDTGKSDRFLAKLASYWKNARVEGITPEAIRRSARMIYPNAQPATWNRQVIVPTAAAINYASSLGWCDPIRVKRFTVTAKKKTPADLAWVNAFASQATQDGLPHLAALCLFMFATGARVGEATALTWADVDLSSAIAIISQTKTEHIRDAHLPSRVIAALANIGGNRNPSELVFGYAGRGSVTKVWNNVAARAGIEPLTPHCCRHGFATSMLHQGFDPKTVAERGGWKDATTVLRTYAHALKDKTVTDALFDTKLTQPDCGSSASIRNHTGNTA
ncbi:tyrosine-type recombinase/integrase [Pontibaca salina]|uniref:Site-specific integrase n=1 Tax=Pontibaca salina TaxID=2795731 RepID=A0A934LZA8_9RHOB|nr:site-specific integrase [Pontibaca salina]MBI6630702.1 site-specific integrase [Pontibaca salina]